MADENYKCLFAIKEQSKKEPQEREGDKFYGCMHPNINNAFRHSFLIDLDRNDLSS
jgi:hypothetical protein